MPNSNDVLYKYTQTGTTSALQKSLPGLSCFDFDISFTSIVYNLDCPGSLPHVIMIFGYKCPTQKN